MKKTIVLLFLVTFLIIGCGGGGSSSGDPTGPTGPSNPSSPGDQTNPSGPGDQTNPTNPGNPTDPVDPNPTDTTTLNLSGFFILAAPPTKLDPTIPSTTLIGRVGSVVAYLHWDKLQSAVKYRISLENSSYTSNDIYESDIWIPFDTQTIKAPGDYIFKVNALDNSNNKVISSTLKLTIPATFSFPNNKYADDENRGYQLPLGFSWDNVHAGSYRVLLFELPSEIATPYDQSSFTKCVYDKTTYTTGITINNDPNLSTTNNYFVWIMACFNNNDGTIQYVTGDYPKTIFK